MPTVHAQNQYLFKDETTGIEVWMKRLDKQFSESLGNKMFKLKYNLQEAKRLGCQTLLTFGGAYSNHIAAVAAVGQQEGFHTIGVIRGEELGRKLSHTLKHNQTLSKAYQAGMRFEFVSRKAYRHKHEPDFQHRLRQKYGNIYILPEGGTNALAVKGCEEILTAEDAGFEVICCPVGTGGTLSGLINSSALHQTVLGFSALQATMEKEIKPFVHTDNWQVFPDIHFKGFAKINEDLVSFINEFKRNHHILLDPIYTGKMMYALWQKIKNNYFQKNIRILAIHSGGLQSLVGMNAKLVKMGRPTIKITHE